VAGKPSAPAALGQRITRGDGKDHSSLGFNQGVNG
jgi:hypothetical protein